VTNTDLTRLNLTYPFITWTNRF